MKIKVNYKPNEKQKLFHGCPATYCVYGGAKGGGKSRALIMEAIVWGCEHAKANMYIFRESYKDLEENLIKEFLENVPKELYTYNKTTRVALLKNGTTITFTYCSSEDEARGYNGRNIDWLGIDELTFHTEKEVQLLLSCLRSAKGYRVQFRATCNPGGVGHNFVKNTYIVPTEYGKKVITDEIGITIAFIPANVYDNVDLMQNDPMYARRLENLPDNEKRAYLYGDWDIFEGQYFNEFRQEIHTIDNFDILDIPVNWNRYGSLDYGLDMTAFLWYAVDEQGRVYVYREFNQKDLTYRQAVKAILNLNRYDLDDEKSPQIVNQYIAVSPDLFNRSQDTGESGFEIMTNAGLRNLVKANNARVAGWRLMKEYFTVFEDEFEFKRSKVRIFKNCKELIRCIPLLQHSKLDPDDIDSKKNHDITHSTDSFRYGLMSRLQPNMPSVEYRDDFRLSVEENEINDFVNCGC